MQSRRSFDIKSTDENRQMQEKNSIIFLRLEKLHSKHEMLHFQPGMLHFQQEMPRFLQEMLHVLQEMLHVLQEMLHVLQEMLHVLQEMLHVLQEMPHIKLEMLHIQHGMFRCKQEMGLFLPGMLRSKQGKPPFQGRAVAAAPPLNNGLRGNAALPVIRWPSASGGRPQGPRWGERPRELLYFSFYPKPSTINFQPSTDFSHR